MTSFLYKELTEKELQTLVEQGLQTKMLSARLLTGGLFNTTYLVETEAYGKTVLRVGPVNRHLLMPFEHYLMEAEEKVYELYRQQGILTSEILAADTSKTILDRDFMFVRYIPSKPMSEVKLAADDRARISKEIGEATARMHRIMAPHFGRIVDVAKGGAFEKWSDALLHELSEWEIVGVPAEIFTKEEHQEVHQLFEKAIPYLDEVKEPCLVHADLWLGNILITDSERPDFAAIIDADRALWGDPDFEFSSIWWTHSEESFWKGYGKELSMKREDRIRRGIYHLLNRLWNSYVYLKEYDQLENMEWERNEARKQIVELRELLAEK